MMETTTKPDRGSPQRSIETDSRRMLSGLRVLIVEDMGMVAMALKAMLEAIGCVVVGMAARLPEAEELMRRETFDGVLLDLNLGGKYAFPVVDILRERDIPFIIVSGYDAGQLRPELSAVPQIQKPFDRATLEAMLLMAFCARRNGGETA
jgi:CheY-like chemotaxis protein